MRPNHNHNNKNRMRGRHNNNRKPSNPLARSYESNGPDMKVRGTPQHIVEKYSQLARDAQVAGDPVLAEAYLQHAEHYYRIISAAHAAMAQAQGLGRPGDADADDGDDDDDLTGMQQPYPDFRQQQQALQQQRAEAFAEQPQPEGGPPFPPRPVYQERQDRPERQNFNDRQGGDRQGFDNRGERQPFVERGERPDRGEQRPPYGDRQDRGEQRPPYGDRQDRGDRRFPPRGPRQDFRPRRPEREPEADAPESALPSFITGGGQPRPVNGSQNIEPVIAQAAGEPPAKRPENDENGDAPFRARRRRRTRAEIDADAAGERPGVAAGRSEDQPVD